MSTLDVTCGRCDKSFRVRAEFAGRATRCPGCSAPLTIGGSAPAPAPRETEPERPRPRPKDDDDRPRRITGNWKPVDTALGREQSALVCLLIQVGCIVLAFCLARLAEPLAGPIGWMAVVPMAILIGGPALAAVVFGISARVAATGAPEESLARGTARASLLLSFAALASLAFLALAFLVSIDSPRGGDPLAAQVALGAAAVSTLAALLTFAMFVAQVGMARRSAAVSRGVGRLAIGATVCAFVEIGIGGLYAVADMAFGPGPAYSPYGPYSRNHDGFFLFTVFGLFPISLIVLLILYHRLLAAARRSIQGDEA